MTLNDSAAFRLGFSSTESRPLVYWNGIGISALRFCNDVQRLSRSLTAQGDVLITCDGRYGFAVAMLAAWLSGHAVILPPNRLQRTLDSIRDGNTVVFEGDEAWAQSLMVSVSRNPGGHGDWQVGLPASQTGVKLFTSGSTGEPKVVAKSIGNLLAEAETLFRTFDWPDGAVVATVPPQHLYGLTFSLLLPWVVGLPWLDETPFYPEDVFALVQSTAAGTLISVPVQYKAMLAEQLSLRLLTCVSAAAPLGLDLAEAWLRQQSKEILEIYGSTETGVIAHRHQVSESDWQVFDNVEIDEAGGVLAVTSPFVSHEYGYKYQTADRIYRSGDRGFQLLGRADSIVKIGGKRVSLDGITNQLLACDGVLDAVAIASDTNGLVRDKTIWAAVVVADKNVCGARQLRAFLRGRLDSIEIPKRLLFVDQLPRTASGKLPQKRLESLFETQEKGSV